MVGFVRLFDSSRVNSDSTVVFYAIVYSIRDQAEADHVCLAYAPNGV